MAGKVEKNTGNSWEKAKAFLNMTLIKKDGTKVNLPKGLALHEGKLEKLIIDQGQDFINEMMKKGKIILTLNVLDENSELSVDQF